MKIIKDIFYSEKRDAKRALDVYAPNGKSKSVFVYIHGGGIEKGDKSEYSENVAKYLTDRNIAFVSINYSLYPNTESPEFIRDAAMAVRWVSANMKELFGCEELYVGGSSAGGYISMMLCFDKRYLAEVGLDNSAIEGYLHDAGQPTAHFNVLKYKGIDPKRIIVDETAPLYYIGLEKEYPRMRFIVSDNDMKNRYEQTMLVLSTMKHFGYENFDFKLMHGKHCEYCKRIDENGDSELAKLIFDFINSGE